MRGNHCSGVRIYMQKSSLCGIEYKQWQPTTKNNQKHWKRDSMSECWGFASKTGKTWSTSETNWIEWTRRATPSKNFMRTIQEDAVRPHCTQTHLHASPHPSYTYIMYINVSIFIYLDLYLLRLIQRAHAKSQWPRPIGECKFKVHHEAWRHQHHVDGFQILSPDRCATFQQNRPKRNSAEASSMEINR